MNRATILTLLVALSLARAIEVKPVVQAKLLGVGVGTPVLAGEPIAWTLPELCDFKLMEVGAGVRLDRHFALCVGTDILHVMGWNMMDYLPVKASVMYDFNPDSRWKKAVVYATWSWCKYLGMFDDWSASAIGEGLGISYTWYGISPRFEFNLFETYGPFDAGRLLPFVSLGVDLGGTYVIGAARK